MTNLIVIITSLVLAVIVIVYLTWKNNSDKQVLNPDAEDAVEESRMDEERRRERT